MQFNDTGDFLITSSMDHTCKLLDLNALKHRTTFRGHVDSVNDVQFKPYSNIFASASADKTVIFLFYFLFFGLFLFYNFYKLINF